MMRAGFGFTTVWPLTVTAMPADHNIAVRMSESVPPHLPSARTGRISGSHETPATPTALLPAAAAMPATRVPCHELYDGDSLPHSAG